MEAHKYPLFKWRSRTVPPLQKDFWHPFSFLNPETITVCSSFLKKLVIYYIFLTVLGLHRCARALSSCGKWELLPSCGAEASHCSGACCRAWALECLGFRSCGTWAWLPCSMWDLPRPRIEPMSHALAGRFSTTGPSGKSHHLSLNLT